MTRAFSLTLITLVTAFAAGACATDHAPIIDDATPSPQIHSAAQLATYLQNTPNTPLDQLAPAAKQRFIASLMFNDNGLTSYQYLDLQALPATQVYQILRLFDAEDTAATVSSQITNDSDRAVANAIPEGMENAICTEKGQCKAQQGCICLASC